MKRISLISLACVTALLVPLIASATPNPNSAVVSTRIFNDCPFTTVNVVNNYPSLISIQDVGLACFGFANLHNWTLSTDGTTGAAFDNNSDFRFSFDLVIDGTGKGEAGLRISPWWSHDVDGRFNVRTSDGEIACFGGRLPFYSFTANYGLHYTKGDPIHLEATYKPHGLNASSPATIEYELTYLGATYSSGVLTFDQANPAEDPPHGLWGMLNDGRVGGYIQPNMEPGNFNSDLKATFTNIKLVICPIEPDADLATVTTRVFNDCPFTNLTVTNNYPSLVSFRDEGLACFGFANLNVWTVSDDGNVGHAIENDDDFSIAMDFQMTGKGEGGIRISPWWSKDADGLFNVRSTDGEIACFGGRLPFYSFTGNFGLRYTMGDVIHLAATYKHNGLSQESPGTIQYDVVYNGVSYSSGPLNFDQANPSEDPPHGLWGILNDARVGGHAKSFMTPGDFTATTTANFSNIVFKSGVDMGTHLTPSVFNLGSNGRFITADLQPPAGYAAADIDVSSLRLNGQLGPSGTPVIGDPNGDGIAELTVKFDRLAAGGVLGGSGLGTITGCIGSFDFAGSDNIKVVNVKHPTNGASVITGSAMDVDWDTPAGLENATADIYTSIDGGENWTLAGSVANSGHYTLAAPGTPSTKGRVAVTLSTGTDAASGFSGLFALAAPVGVGDESVAFGLKGAFPNPSTDRMNIRFSLPDNKRATLSLFDVSGRRLASREVGTLGAGHHTVTLAQRLPAGIYMVRLDRDGTSLKTRAAVVR